MIRTRYRDRAIEQVASGGEPPVNTVAPVASGTARIGETLSCTTGTWTGTAPIVYTYQWRRNGSDITGETNNTYVVVALDAGLGVDCIVTATNDLGPESASSNSIAVPESLAAAVASAVMDLDATLFASYPGSGTTWSNLVASPADGSAQTAYDFFTGDGSTSTTFPTFTGTPGDPASYWLFDGGDYFKIKSGANTTFINAMHKTTGGSDWWIAFALLTPPADSGADGLFGTNQNSTTPGLQIFQNASEQIAANQRGAATSSLSNTGTTLTGSTNYTVFVSHSHSTNMTSFWINSSTGTALSQTYSTTTADASGFMVLAALANGASSFMASGGRMYSVGMGNSYLTNAEAAAIKSLLQVRQGRVYS